MTSDNDTLSREIAALFVIKPSIRVSNLEIFVPENRTCCYIARLSLNQLNNSGDWLINRHMPMIKFKCNLTGIQ